jgi:hypothetical protein
MVSKQINRLISLMLILCGPFIIYFLWPTGSLVAYFIVCFFGMIVVWAIYFLIVLVKMRFTKTNNNN